MNSYHNQSNYSLTDNRPYTVLLPDTPLPSDCEHESVSANAIGIDDDDDMYESCIYDSYYDEIPSSMPSTFTDATIVPRIVVTPTPEDNARRRASLTNTEYFREKVATPNETFAQLSTKLNQLNRNDTEMNISRDDKPFIGDLMQKIENSASNGSASDNACHTNEVDSSQSEESSQSESDEDSSKEQNRQPAKRSDSLQAVRSVTNVKVYDTDSEDEVDEIQDEHDIHDAQPRDMEYYDEDSADIIDFIFDHNQNDDYLSIIYEEDERSHSRRQKFDSMCSDNSSATLANDNQNSAELLDTEDLSSTEQEDSDASDNDSSEQETENEEEDDKSNSVTVRLPLRLSFSRSSNDEEITTVMVGKSEIEYEETSECVKLPPVAESSSDVSVSFSLRRPGSNRSNEAGKRDSMELTSRTSSMDYESDSEVSVSVSLPMRNRRLTPSPFVRQQTLSPVPHDRSAFEYKPYQSASNRSSMDCSEIKNITAHMEAITNQINEEKDVSVRDRIAAFETITPAKEELQRQNAYEMDECSSDEESIESYGNDKLEAQTKYTEPCRSYITRSPVQYYNDHCDYENKHDFPEEKFDEEMNMENAFKQDVDDKKEAEEMENDQANLSVRDKIAAFEQPISSNYSQVDARREITLARQNSQRETTNTNTNKITNTNEITNEYSPVQFTNTTQNETNCRTQNSSNNDSNINTELNTNKYLDKSSYMQRSFPDESELDEDDSGVVMDVNHRITTEETDTESECFPELRKLTRYERAATHSRLFKLLQECEGEPNENSKHIEEESPILSRPKKIVHNVSITRKQNPDAIKNAETMCERRERLALNFKQSSSIDADNPSSASPSCASPTPSVNEKLIDELVQSVLQQTKRRNLRNIPIEKIQAAARRALQQQQDENDSCDTTFSSFDSTPALTPQEFKDDYYYDSDTCSGVEADRPTDILPSKAFKNLQEQSVYGRKRKLWAARCPRVLSSKTVNSDLCRVAETRESQTPERDNHQYPYPI